MIAPVSFLRLIIYVFSLFTDVSLTRNFSVLLIFFPWRTSFLFHWFFHCLLFSVSLITPLIFIISSLLKNLFIYLFSFGCAGSLLLWKLFSSCGKRGPLSSCSAPTSLRWLLVAEHRLLGRAGIYSCYHMGSVVAALGLQSRGSIVVAHGLSCSVVCGIDPDEVSNLCLLHSQADSLPLSHLGCPLDELAHYC